jgi:uncharacterized damage-inducible protein DinB
MITLKDMLAYDRWANRKYLDAIGGVTHEQFTQTLGGSFGSVRDTLVHLAWAEWVWTKRWQGTSPQVRARQEEFPTIASVRNYLEEVAVAQEKVFEGREPDIRGVRITYTNLKHEVWEYTMEDMVHHLTMHSAYHRGQLATLLRQLGVVPPTTDYLVYVDEREHRKENS